MTTVYAGATSRLEPVTTIKRAEQIAGTLGDPSKMPGRAYGLPAASAPWVPAYCEADGLPVPPSYGCPTGALMARVRGTTCSACYADERGRYGASSVKKGQTRRVVGVHHPQWVDAMVLLITRKVDPREPYFRWHDSGDLLGLWHLRRIVEVAQRCPWVSFWLPTREAKVVDQYLEEHGDFPRNLVVRVSATKVDGKPPRFTNTSTVHDKAKPVGHACPAPQQGNKCASCRACWSRDVRNVSYHLH